MRVEVKLKLLLKNGILFLELAGLDQKEREYVGTLHDVSADVVCIFYSYPGYCIFTHRGCTHNSLSGSQFTRGPLDQHYPYWPLSGRLFPYEKQISGMSPLLLLLKSV